MKFKFIQGIIDTLRGKIFGLPSVVRKYESYLRVKDFHTLALGSSHMDGSYITAEGEINMGSPSQDLYYSYNLYKLMNKDSLKTVILTFSVFTPGDFLIKTDLNKMCVIYKLCYGIPYQCEQLAKKSKLKLWEKYIEKHIIKYRKSLELQPTHNKQVTNSSKKYNQQKDEIQIRALKHYKINRRPYQMDYFVKFLEETKHNQQNFYIVLPPMTSFYKEVLPSSNIIYEELYKACKNYPHAKILNLYDSTEFQNSDFADGDHLNSTGAKKFTAMIKKELF